MYSTAHKTHIAKCKTLAATRVCSSVNRLRIFVRLCRTSVTPLSILSSLFLLVLSAWSSRVARRERGWSRRDVADVTDLMIGRLWKTS